MANNIDPSLILGNKALQEKRYSEAIEIFRQAIRQHPKLEKYISFNILLAKSKLKNESFADTIYNEEIAKYIDETNFKEKLPLTALIITSDRNRNSVERAYIVTEILDRIVKNTVISCLQVSEKEGASLLSFKDKAIPIIAIEKRNYSELFQLEMIVEKMRPDIVFACNLHIPLFPFGATLKQKYKIPLIADMDDSNPIAGEYLVGGYAPVNFNATPVKDVGQFSDANVVEKINFRKIFLGEHNYKTTNEKLRSLITSNINKINKQAHEEKIEFSVLRKADSKVVSKKEKTPGKDIVIFWKQNDTGLYGRRPDMIVKYLASRADTRKVIVIDSPISEKELREKRKGSPLTHDREIYTKTYEKIFGQLDQEKVSYYVYINKNQFYFNEPYEKTIKKEFSSYSEYLDRLFHREQIDTQKSVFWFYPKNYFGADIIETFKPEKVVVDVVDDHRAWPDVPAQEKKKLTSHYKDILSRADICIANCRPVAESMKEFHKDIVLIPNGCEEVPEFIEPIDNPMYEELKSANQKVIGFVGNLESKIDILLLEKLAQCFENELIVLVGSTHTNPKVKDLAKYPNIRMFGVIEYKYINAIVRKFTVGIVPHLKTPLTENMSPLKVFVYAANQIPVVCSNIDNLPEGRFIHIAETHNGFIEKCRSILKGEITLDNQDYIDFIKSHSWHSRLHSVLNRI